jgi:hypothetical protein
MGWNDLHRRSDVLRRVIDEADRRRDGVLPVDVPGVAETFADELDLVGALHLRWHTRLSGHIEQALSDDPADPESAVLRGWRAAASELAGVRAVLDACTAAPATEEMARVLRRAQDKEWALLAAMAGRAGASDDRAAAVGRRIEQDARAAYRPTVPAQHHRARGSVPGRADALLDRLRAHLPV